MKYNFKTEHALSEATSQSHLWFDDIKDKEVFRLDPCTFSYEHELLCLFHLFKMEILAGLSAATHCKLLGFFCKASIMIR